MTAPSPDRAAGLSLSDTKDRIDCVVQAFHAGAIDLDAALKVIALSEIVAEMVMDGSLPDVDFASDLLAENIERRVQDKRLEQRLAEKDAARRALAQEEAGHG